VGYGSAGITEECLALRGGAWSSAWVRLSYYDAIKRGCGYAQGVIKEFPTQFSQCHSHFAMHDSVITGSLFGAAPLTRALFAEYARSTLADFSLSGNYNPSLINASNPRG
jgi:hypothetical protein